ncbi:bifunctional diaminohydroxyphosphoribosylaminopyrimidine deaminase/5-amino-6-(5-phosphoribosylamino)uracil reductase RibD [Marinilabiliaceae bacterium JC017]|nr:bifunctional diaminohydroxyphosphoribosylaminopyrimidine deaminase/5-amino-6-(5-phosphoribosylamino)uracil reductase RibD [Marinilabiliaceae bacterium JC017]
MNQLNTSEKYMQRCLDLAILAEGNTYPNPLVGSVIVHNNKIIGEGYHCKAGEPHAEINAIRSVKNKALLTDSTLYVNLEPCAHFGKTPPCSLAIIKNKIPRVVIGCVDSFSEVAGKGIEMLRGAGVEVTVGILEKESRFLNRRFFTFHEKKRPYIVLKWAQTLDGYIDVDRDSLEYGEPTWITNEWARRAVHKQRTHEQAILIGTHTAQKDNPSLTVRDWCGHQPHRLIIDKQLTLSPELTIFDHKVPTIIFNTIKDAKEENLEYIKLTPGDDWHALILKTLYKRGFQSIIVEGGYQLLESFIQASSWDEAHVYVGQKWFRQGVKAPKIACRPEAEAHFNDSHLYVYHN